MGKRIVLILKTAERCNLNCKYCYFFNGGDQSYKKHPPLISKTVLEQLVSFLTEGIKDLGIEHILVVFHGGEPLLQPVYEFMDMCSLLQKHLSPLTSIDFKIQTNATLVAPKWIHAFSEFRVSVGVSLDGPKEYNDIDRVDHRNRGSYDAVKRGIDLLQEAAGQKKIPDILSYCVINPERDARVIYRHLVDDLKIKRMDYLLPDLTYDDCAEMNALPYGKFLCDLFDEWTKDQNPEIKLRILESILSTLAGRSSVITSMGPGLEDVDVLTVSSNGKISPDDILRKAGSGQVMELSSVDKISLKNFIELPTMQKIKNCKTNLSKKCLSCCWQNVCQGGSYVHRYSSKNGFDNPSIMCEGLKMIFSKCSAFLLKNGVPIEKLREALGF